MEAGSELLSIYIKKVEKGYNFIMFDHESLLPFFHAPDDMWMSKLYIEPYRGVITKRTINSFAEHNNYTKILVMKMDTYYHIIVDYDGPAYLKDTIRMQISNMLMDDIYKFYDGDYVSLKSKMTFISKYL